ncbi:hypothetical protein BDW62DRAFT_197283 [Aspergillus aurantiobrunneus]
MPPTTPKNFYIFGSGISFSISPTIHTAGFTHHNLAYTYEIAESRTIDDVAHLINSPSFGGASVTMPHKLQVHRYCSEQTETARTIGAINTLIPRYIHCGKTEVVGDNTDWSGLYTLICRYMAISMEGEVGEEKKGLKAGLVIGAGGASRAALYALYEAGVERIYLVNRTISSAETVRDDFRGLFDVIVVPSISDLPRSPEVVIGTVPAETTSEEQFTSMFKGQGLCIDMSYKPRQTPLLTVAQRHEGWATVTGVEVLLAQAFDQFRLWTGLEPPREEMIDAILKREGEGERVAMSML